MVNLRVRRFSGVLQVCSSEVEVPASGWVIAPEGRADRPAEPEWQVFHDGEFTGDVGFVDTAEADGRPFTELGYIPVPAED